MHVSAVVKNDNWAHNYTAMHAFILPAVEAQGVENALSCRSVDEQIHDAFLDELLVVSMAVLIRQRVIVHHIFGARAEPAKMMLI